MVSDDPVDRGQEYLKVKDYKQAVREFKTAVGLNKKDSEAYSYLARAYLKLGNKSQEPVFYQTAEKAIRKALKLDPRNMDYHDILIRIKTKTNTLDKLCREYRLKKNRDKIYDKLLKKIAVIGVMSVPRTDGKTFNRPKGIFFLNYIIVPLLTALGLITRFHSGLKKFSLPLFMTVGGYVLFRILSRPQVKDDIW